MHFGFTEKWNESGSVACFLNFNMVVSVDSLSALFIQDGIDLEIRNLEVPFSYINMIKNNKKETCLGVN